MCQSERVSSELAGLVQEGLSGDSLDPSPTALLHPHPPVGGCRWLQIQKKCIYFLRFHSPFLVPFVCFYFLFPHRFSNFIFHFLFLIFARPNVTPTDPGRAAGLSLAKLETCTTTTARYAHHHSTPLHASTAINTKAKLFVICVWARELWLNNEMPQWAVSRRCLQLCKTVTALCIN